MLTALLGLQLVTALLSGAAAAAALLGLRARREEHREIPEEPPAAGAGRIQEGIANLLTYELGSREERE